LSLPLPDIDWLLSFILLGPWGAAKFNTDACTLFCGDAVNMDKTTKGENKSRKSQRDLAEVENSDNRDSNSGRGISSLAQKQIDLTTKELDQKDLLILLERDQLKLVQTKDSRAAIILELIYLSKQIMNDLKESNDTEYVDDNGVNRYKLAYLIFFFGR